MGQSRDDMVPAALTLHTAPRNAKNERYFVMTQSTVGVTATPSPDTAATQAPRARDSYQRLIEEIRSVPESELVAINIDVPTAVATAMGALPMVKQMRPSMAALPTFDIARFDKLEDYALALAYAHTRYIKASAPAEPFEELVAAGTALRELLLADGTALAARNFISRDRLKELRGSTGYLDLAFDLSALADMMRDVWPSIASLTAVKPAELDRAETIAEQLIGAFGRRAQEPEAITASAEMRHRAFSLFVSTYDAARRAVSYVRWREADVDTIAPSLYANRSSRKKQGGGVQQGATTTAPAAGAGAPTPAPPAVQAADVGSGAAATPLNVVK